MRYTIYKTPYNSYFCVEEEIEKSYIIPSYFSLKDVKKILKFYNKITYLIVYENRVVYQKSGMFYLTENYLENNKLFLFILELYKLLRKHDWDELEMIKNNFTDIYNNILLGNNQQKIIKKRKMEKNGFF